MRFFVALACIALLAGDANRPRYTAFASESFFKSVLKMCPLMHTRLDNEASARFYRDVCWNNQIPAGKRIVQKA